ncbi:methyl-accepting chemotaxis protein [Photobacterium minamisatsumaniensis]|uniref:methyl-accepting chemotaxis protein n=1 Tax=Photobacterium minamisatsumaniensis TaxID=2910233 RepID=UPI003D0C8DAB
MNLTDREKRWLPWFGKTGKIAMQRAWRLNRSRRDDLAQAFDSIANTRVNLLKTWAQNQWGFINDAALYLESKSENSRQDTLARLLKRGTDFSELFITNVNGEIIHSSYVKQIGHSVSCHKAHKNGLKEAYLHGPYLDKTTLQIGPSSSTFHDEVTLMFYLPLTENSIITGCLCGRVPNDVIGDIIQREAGHIYNESGDNYLFMVNAYHDTSIKPGVALSRSRFEDNSFSHGDNLKQGIETQWGTVRIKAHTEFEIMFTDPATNELHPGVRETIRNGSNLFIDYPGYSDYRHIPVIGKGVTFSLPGSPDRWGMMCESDLEEVYRHRSLRYSLTQKYLSCLLLSTGLPFALTLGFNLSLPLQLLAFGVTAILSSILFHQFGASPIAQGLKEMTQVMHVLAEGNGNLTQRLNAKDFKPDESGDLGRWTNSFIDNLEGTVTELLFATEEVKQVSESMFRRSQTLSSTSQETSIAIEAMLTLSQHQTDQIEGASDSAQDIDTSMQQAVESAESEYHQALENAASIKSIVKTSASSVNDVNHEMAKINDIASMITAITDQTNLLALNAAIEAARAGEHGRGFSVVADEVRILADRTSQAANHIGDIMKELHQRSATAVTHMEQGLINVEQSTITVDYAKRSEGLHQSVSGLFTTINQLAENSQKHRETADGAKYTTEQLVVASQQLSRRNTLLKNSLQRLDQLTNRFELQ